MIVDYSTRKANLADCSKKSSFGSLIGRSISVSPKRTRSAGSRGREKTARNVQSAMKLWDQVDLLDESSARHGERRGNKLESSIRKLDLVDDVKMSYTPATLQIRRRRSSFESSLGSLNSSLGSLNSSLGSLNNSLTLEDLDDGKEEAPWKQLDFEIRKSSSGNKLDEQRHRTSQRGREIAQLVPEGARGRLLSPQRQARNRPCSPTTPIRRNGSGTQGRRTTPTRTRSGPAVALTGQRTTPTRTRSGPSPLAVAPPEYWARPEHQLESGLVGISQSSGHSSAPSMSSLLSCDTSTASVSTDDTTTRSARKRRGGRKGDKSRDNSPTRGGAGWSNLSNSVNLMASQSTALSDSDAFGASYHTAASDFTNATGSNDLNKFVTGSRIRRHNGENNGNVKSSSGWYRKVPATVKPKSDWYPPMLDAPPLVKVPFWQMNLARDHK